MNIRNIIIIGTGGFASEVTQYISDNQKSLPNFHYKIKGYLDIDEKNHKRYDYEHPLLGSEQDYLVQKDDVFLIAIAEINLMTAKKRIVDCLLKKNANFITLIHHTSNISLASKIGIGNIIAPFTTIGPHVNIGDFNTINYNCALGHDATIGNYNILSPYVNITGHTSVQDNNFFGSSISILPKVSIGNNNKLQSGVIIHKNIDSNIFIYQALKNKYIPL